MGRRGNVTAPDGSSWRVGRRWLDWRPPRLHERVKLGDDTGEVVWFGAELADAVGSVWGAAGLTILIALVIIVVLPILGLAIELVLLLLVLLIGLVARLCFGRPWIVEARPVGAGAGHEERERVSRGVRGWRASGEAVAQMRREIETRGATGPTPRRRRGSVAAGRSRRRGV